MYVGLTKFGFVCAYVTFLGHLGYFILATFSLQHYGIWLYLLCMKYVVH